MGLKICKKCGVPTTNMRKHEARDRCKRQHIRKYKKKEQTDNIPNIFMENDTK